MKWLFPGMICALLLLAGPPAAAAQDTKTVTGTVTAVSGDSITVKANDKEMTFKVDAKTRTTARGGATKTRAAQAAGKAGAMLTEVVKTGDGVEVAYHEQGMHAASIRVMPSAPKAAMAADPAKKAQSASGVVSAVSASSLTIKGAAGESTFTVDPKTTVIGTGVGTAARSMTAAGTKTAITEFVHNGDTVSVTYHDMDGTKHAARVRITRKGA